MIIPDSECELLITSVMQSYFSIHVSISNTTTEVRLFEDCIEVARLPTGSRSANNNIDTLFVFLLQVVDRKSVV